MDDQKQTPPSSPVAAAPSAPVAPPATQPQTAPAPPADEPKVLTKTEKLKRSFFEILIGCLIGAAGIAVVAVLVGSFNDTLGRALATIAMVALHAAFSFSYINGSEKRTKKDNSEGSEVFSNIVFTLIAISFITSVFAIWQLVSGDITLKLYLSYGVLLFATMHADALYRLRRVEKKIDTIVAVNYVFMTVVVIMLLILIFSGHPDLLGEFFYRLLAATGIIDATLSMTAIIMHKMHVQKHPPAAPEESSPAQAVPPKSVLRNPFVVIVIIFLIFQLIGSFVALVFRGL